MSKLRPHIRRGVSRTVLIVGNWAIKVPTTRPGGARHRRLWAWTRGYQANESELAWCKTDGVAPVRWHLGSLVVCFARAQPVMEPIPDWDDPWWRRIAPDVPFSDRKPSNIGIIDGRVVWIDYDSSYNGCLHMRWNPLSEE